MYDIFLYPTESHGHWVCTATVDSPTEVKLFDSVGSLTEIQISLLLQIAKLYSTGGILKIRKESVQQQVGNTDCGCFAVAFARDLDGILALPPLTKDRCEFTCISAFSEVKCLHSLKFQRHWRPFPAQNLKSSLILSIATVDYQMNMTLM